MNRTWKWVLIFVLGAGVGFMSAMGTGRCLFHPWGGGRHFQEHMLKQFNDKLKLTPEQNAQVAAILEAKRQKIDALRAEIRPKFEELRSSTRSEIRQLLSSEQQQKFDVMETAFERKAKRFRKHWDKQG